MNKALLIGCFLLTGIIRTQAQSDLCAGAPLLTVSASCSYSNYTLAGGWGAELPSPGCGTNYRDGFFRFVATSTSTTVTVTDNIAGPDPILAVYSGSCGSLTAMGCSNNGNNMNEQVTIATTIGTTYYIAIMRNNNANTNALSGQVCVSQVAPPLTNTNCSTATQICSTTAFSGNSNGFGTQELTTANEGCLDGENQSSWFYFQAVTSGTVAFTIVTTADYDFALWTGSCGNLGTPVRCSYAGTYGNTGLQAGSGQNSEDALGDGFVNALPVTAGQTYILLVDNYSVDNTNFTMNWNFTGGATLNCTPIPLPVEFVDFIGNYSGEQNELAWITGSERDNEFFTIERSSDGMTWLKIAEKEAAGNSFTLTEYAYTDADYDRDKINYYRLSQTDINGSREDYYKIVSIDNTVEKKTIVRTVNLLGQEVDASYSGIVILQFDDNSCLKIFQ